MTFLEHGIVDIGFVGKDTLEDVDFEDYYELLDLNIGKCYFLQLLHIHNIVIKI